MQHCHTSSLYQRYWHLGLVQFIPSASSLAFTQTAYLWTSSPLVSITISPLHRRNQNHSKSIEMHRNPFLNLKISCSFPSRNCSHEIIEVPRNELSRGHESLNSLHIPSILLNTSRCTAPCGGFKFYKTRMFKNVTLTEISHQFESNIKSRGWSQMLIIRVW